MLLAFMHPFGPQADYPELCLIPSKPDTFSYPIRVETLWDTSAAVYRLGPTEGVRIRRDASEKSILIEPVPPSKLYLTPSQPDRPGFTVSLAKVFLRGQHDYETHFVADMKTMVWKQWLPYEYN